MSSSRASDSSNSGRSFGFSYGVTFNPRNLLQPHHKHARGGDGDDDDYDGCGIHGFSPNLARTLPVFDGGVSDSSYAS
jgi:hypothetical protein